jgi:hypothetical protein
MRIKCDFKLPDGKRCRNGVVDLGGPVIPIYMDCPKCHGTGVIRHSDEDADFMDEPLCDEEMKELHERWEREG